MRAGGEENLREVVMIIAGAEMSNGGED